nr:MAG TPA: hypothetical protein [Caudoviricetes sp.]
MMQECLERRLSLFKCCQISYVCQFMYQLMVTQ